MLLPHNLLYLPLAPWPGATGGRITPVRGIPRRARGGGGQLPVLHRRGGRGHRRLLGHAGRSRVAHPPRHSPGHPTRRRARGAAVARSRAVAVSGAGATT